MPTSDNPFSAPPSRFREPDMDWVDDEGLWRQGNLLVGRKEATFPARCIQTNVPTEKKLKRALYWHPPAIYFLVLLSPIIYIIVALIVRQTATIYIGVSEEVLARRRMAILLGWVGGFVGLVIFIAAFPLSDGNDALLLLAPAGLAVLFISMIAAMVKSRIVAPTKIDKRHMWLKGAGEEFLASLPEWPHDE